MVKWRQSREHRKCHGFSEFNQFFDFSLWSLRGKWIHVAWHWMTFPCLFALGKDSDFSWTITALLLCSWNPRFGNNIKSSSCFISYFPIELYLNRPSWIVVCCVLLCLRLGGWPLARNGKQLAGNLLMCVIVVIIVICPLSSCVTHAHMDECDLVSNLMF